MARSKTHQSRIEKAEKQKKALNLRRAGLTFQEIGDTIGCTRGYAYKLVSRALQEYRTETEEAVKDLRATECARIDQVLRGIWPKAINGNLGAIDRFVKLTDQRAKLLGINAPTKIAPTDPSGDNEYGAGGLAALLAGTQDGDGSDNG